jgi:hypothetical protein
MFMFIPLSLKHFGNENEINHDIYNKFTCTSSKNLDINTKQICLNGHTHPPFVHLTTILKKSRSAYVLIYNNDFQKN